MSFRGEFNQKVDGKGRMSIPADFRRALEAGDPEYPEKRANPRMVVLYGPHLKHCLHVYTITDMAEIEADIRALKRGTAKRKQISRMILGKSLETEVDRDGRMVLPKDRRAQINLDGLATMVAMGDYFEIWNAATFEAIEGAEMEALDSVEASEMEAYFANQPEAFDPLALLDGVGGA